MYLSLNFSHLLPIFYYIHLSLHGIRAVRSCTLILQIQQMWNKVKNKLKSSKEVVVFNADGTFQHSNCQHSHLGNMQQSSANLWHHRLRHVPFSKLKLISGIQFNADKVDNVVCVSCPLAKHTHLPYSRNEYSCKVPFGMIHMDIWGPYRVFTLG